MRADAQTSAGDRRRGFQRAAQIPVLAIDQCIAGPGIEPVRYRLDATLLSDHRMQVFDFQVIENFPNATV